MTERAVMICRRCGVELDEQMKVCPLCDNYVAGNKKAQPAPGKALRAAEDTKPALMRHILWQIVCVLLLSGIIATLVINLSIVRRVTWSIYPVVICLIVFSYASLLALWHVKLFLQILTGWIVSSVLLIGIGIYMEQVWPTALALPILCTVNLIVLLLTLIVGKLNAKGLNVVAIIFVAIAVLCLFIEGIISVYLTDRITLNWSVVVAACLLPVTAAILFMYFRTRNNSELQKIFHT